MHKISIVLKEQVPDIWEKVLPFLDEAVKTSDGRMSTANTFDRIMSQQIFLWVAYDETTLQLHGAATTHVTLYDSVKFLTVELLGGNEFFEWRDQMQQALVKLAIAEGARGIELIGREGWVRALKDLGWKPKFTTCQYLIGENDLNYG